MLSAENVSFNTLFEFADFSLPGPRHKLVHGSFMRESYIVVRSASSGQLLHFEHRADQPGLGSVLFADGATDTHVSDALLEPHRAPRFLRACLPADAIRSHLL